ncbi:hypothetical protein [Sporosarcina sp. FSL K6-3457]|uniref:hypothetical protein n=1 Tax=Sporosarcina sp. FSL K6-3457 TaxID=2978204 RepID=UPI0030FBF41E
MDINYKQFMGLTTPIHSKADVMLNGLLKDLVLSMDHYFQSTTSKSNDFHCFVNESKKQYPEVLYFWEWMDEKGFRLLKELDKRLPESEEIVEYLNYRRVILEMDVESGELDNFLLSVTELLISVSGYLMSYFETAATAIEISEGKITLPHREVHYKEIYWNIIEGSATTGAGLLLYVKGEIMKWINQQLTVNMLFPKQ